MWVSLNVPAYAMMTLTLTLYRDLHRLHEVQLLQGHSHALTHVCVNHTSGDIVTVALHEIRVYDVNGEVLCVTNTMWFGLGVTTSACCTRCPQWQDGVTLVTGHVDGSIVCW